MDPPAGASIAMIAPIDGIRTILYAHFKKKRIDN